jgi:hypothetical protein
MLSSASIRSKVSLTKNFISDQTWGGFVRVLNTSLAFDVTEGFGQAADNSSIILINVGGFNDQKITGNLKWVLPTLTTTYEIGVLARVQQTLTTGGATANYYYARCDGDTAKLTKVVSSVFTNLSTNAFVLPINTPVEIILSCVGSSLSATFTCAGVPGSPLTLTATDTAITTGGLMGMRSLTSSVWFRSFTAEEL